MTILKYDGVINVTLDTIWYLYYHSHTKFHNQGLTGSEIMTGVEGSFVTDYLMLKKSMLVRVKMASPSII